MFFNFLNYQFVVCMFSRLYNPLRQIIDWGYLNELNMA